MFDACGVCDGPGDIYECPDNSLPAPYTNNDCLDVADICGSGSLTTDTELEYCSCACNQIDECGDCKNPQCSQTPVDGVHWSSGKNPCDAGYFPTNTDWNSACQGCTEAGPASNENCNYDNEAIVDDGSCIDSHTQYGPYCDSCNDTPDDGFCNCEGYVLDCGGECNESPVNQNDSLGNCCNADIILTYYPDLDGDGLGENVNSITVCANATAPEGYVLNNEDCVDGNGLPAAVDACGVCNPTTINQSCTGCTDPSACNIHEGCSYTYTGEAGILVTVSECLFTDNSQCDYPNYCEDCDGNCLAVAECVAGCDGDCGSGNVLDECGVCGGNHYESNQEPFCGEPFGADDIDGVNCCDCAGVPNGSTVFDDCEPPVCGGIGPQPCANMMNGAICGGDQCNPNDDCYLPDDCMVCDGNDYITTFGELGEYNSEATPGELCKCLNSDFDELPDASDRQTLVKYYWDDCNICNGTCFNPLAPGETQPNGCLECGCFDIPATDCNCLGDVLDDCGYCGGDNSSCTGCLETEANNFNVGCTTFDGTNDCLVPCNGCCTFDLETEFESDYIESGKKNFIAFTLPPRETLMCAGTWGFATAADADCSGKQEGDPCAGLYNDYDFNATGICAQYEITRTLANSIFSINPDENEGISPENLFIEGDKLFTIQNELTEPDYTEFWTFYTTGGIGRWVQAGNGSDAIGEYFEIGKGYKLQTDNSMWLKWKKFS